MTTKLPHSVFVVLLAGMLALAASLWGGPLRADDATRLAGSTQLDYLFVPAAVSSGSTTFDGFTTELSMKVTHDVTESLAAQTKFCYSCHGVELGVATMELSLGSHVGVRAGRFTPAFGDFPARHDPANHHTSDKPLPYDMGRMLRMREWNMSVLPTPYVDNGVEVSVNVPLGSAVEADLTAYVVSGLRGSNTSTDFDFIQSRSDESYYVDNNSVPSVGGRAVFTGRTSLGPWHVGTSAMAGHYDPAAKRSFLFLGADFSFRASRWTLRAEYLIRRLEMALGDQPAVDLVYGPSPDGRYSPVALKDGFYVEAEVPLAPVDLIARFDGMTRVGNVPIGSVLRDRSWVLRSTLALRWLPQPFLSIKTSAEYYQFSDFADQFAFHLGVVTSF